MEDDEFRCWPIATFGGHATIWSLSERSGYRSASELDGSVANDPGLAEDVYNIFASVAVSRRLDNCQMLLVGRVREGLCQGSSNILSLYRRPRVPTFPSTGDVYSR